jgi:hypothetical protein
MADRVHKPLFEMQIVRAAILLLTMLLSNAGMGDTSQKPSKPARPEVPWGVVGLNPAQTGAYDSRAQPVAEALQALNAMNQRGWETIKRYYSKLGTESENASPKVSPSNPEDQRFFATFVTEDPGRSPLPLIVMICSLDSNEVSGRLKFLRDELLEATRLEDYSAWTAERLRLSIRQLTQEQTTDKGVKYRAPKRTLSFKESVQLYAMTVALLDKDTKWAKWQESIKQLGYSLPPMPDMTDFSNRLRHQLPLIIPPGATRGLLLYRPGWDLAQPRSKEEYEERADVVLIKRSGPTFQVEQFPIYLTAEKDQWNPPWILPQDDVKDSTLMGRKLDELWTRFDGPYLCFKNDQLNGEVTYTATVKFQQGDILIEAERFVLRRGSVVRTARDPSYDPLKMKRFVAGTEVSADPLTVDPLDLDMWPAMWRHLARDINETCYRHDDRRLFWYKTEGNSWTSSVYPRQDAGSADLVPIQPVTAPSGGLVARFSSSDSNQPSDVQLLNPEQQGSVGIAVGLMNLCLANAGGMELDALRVALPRDADNLTPIYFYSVRNGASVRRSPNAMVVVLSEGYYSSYASVFNRLLWVLERPFESDAAKVSTINHAIEEFLRNRYPKETTSQNDPAMIAWSELLQGGGVDHLFDPTLLPGAVNPARPPESTPVSQ